MGGSVLQFRQCTELLSFLLNCMHSNLPPPPFNSVHSNLIPPHQIFALKFCAPLNSVHSNPPFSTLCTQILFPLPHFLRHQYHYLCYTQYLEGII